MKTYTVELAKKNKLRNEKSFFYCLNKKYKTYKKSEIEMMYQCDLLLFKYNCPLFLDGRRSYILSSIAKSKFFKIKKASFAKVSKVTGYTAKEVEQEYNLKGYFVSLRKNKGVWGIGSVRPLKKSDFKVSLTYLG